mgnify:CR=1 FL=1
MYCGNLRQAAMTSAHVSSAGAMGEPTPSATATPRSVQAARSMWLLTRPVFVPAALAKVPWWAWTGGVIGALFVASATLLVPQVRERIDAIDEQIVALLAERGRYVKDAARFKRDAFQVSAPQRQQQVFDKVKRLAEQTGAYPEVVDACYRAMVAGFIAREQRDHLDMENTEENP